ncbi:MAG: alpha/beta hydrolase [Proteobacteria bacterium]|nr:alpha/beta hydrolase [Pseudomonadota bacterium]
MVEALDLPPGGIAWDQTLTLEASDGVRLRGALWRGPAGGGARGLVLLLNGRTEFIEKGALPAAALVARGFAVASIDWRGQGLSQRLTATPLKGHVGKFTDYHLDLAALMAHREVAALPGPRLMLAHSMGGTIGLGAIKRGLVAPAAVILSAPMLGINLRPSRRILSPITLRLARPLGKLESWPPFEVADEPQVFTGFAGNTLTGDQEVFEWMAAALRREPALQLGMPTLGWLSAAFVEMAWLALQGPLGCPGLCLLGSREEVVDPALVRAIAARLKLDLVEIGDARHEVLLEAEPMRTEAWTAIDRFLAQSGI